MFGRGRVVTYSPTVGRKTFGGKRKTVVLEGHGIVKSMT